jgi:RNA polymerase sigma-70 factor (ECF subfamily)
MDVPDRAAGATDAELVRSYLDRRSEEAFRRLYRAHTPYLYGLALRLVGARREAADDALQETWIRAAERLGGFAWRSSLRTWLGGILVNCCREQLRRRPAGPAPAGRFPRPAVDDHAADGRLDLERLVAALPDGQREVLVLFGVEGYTHEEIAHHLGIAPGTSKSRLFEARRTLQRRLETDARGPHRTDPEPVPGPSPGPNSGPGEPT